MDKYIEHEGTVTNKTDHSVTVTITTVSACANCREKGACTMADKKDKTVEIKGNYNVKKGDQVTVLMRQELGLPALFLGYLLPLVLVIVSLIVMISLSVNEAISGLISISILLPYYIILRIFRRQIDKKFTFALKS